jgi:hypothetical protein
VAIASRQAQNCSPYRFGDEPFQRRMNNSAPAQFETLLSGHKRGCQSNQLLFPLKIKRTAAERK